MKAAVLMSIGSRRDYQIFWELQLGPLPTPHSLAPSSQYGHGTSTSGLSCLTESLHFKGVESQEQLAERICHGTRCRPACQVFRKRGLNERKVTCPGAYRRAAKLQHEAEVKTR